MRFTFYSDLHIGSKYLEKNILPHTRMQVLSENAYALGDIFELKNCEPSNLANIEARYLDYKEMFSDRYVTGNHECDKGLGPITVELPGKILLVHGDIILYSLAKYQDFRANAHGQGSGFIQWIMNWWHGSLNSTELELIANYANSRNCGTVVLGHVHPRSTIYNITTGVRIICLPRGKTVVDL